MPPITNSNFLGIVYKARGIVESPEELLTFVRDTPQFKTIIDKIMENNDKWAKSVGLLKEKAKKEESSLSEQQIEWRNYFHSHSFVSAEDARNTADMLTILTGIDMLPFLKVSRSPAKSKFPAFVSIVPIVNNYSHNYRLGKPALSLTSGLTFYKESGDSGNSMGIGDGDYRMSTRDEVIYIVSALLYRLSSSAEYLISNLVASNAGDNE